MTPEIWSIVIKRNTLGAVDRAKLYTAHVEEMYYHIEELDKRILELERQISELPREQKAKETLEDILDVIDKHGMSRMWMA